MLVIRPVDLLTRGTVVLFGSWFIGPNQEPAKLGGKVAVKNWPFKSGAYPAKRFLGLLVHWILDIARVFHGVSRWLVLGLAGFSV